MIDLAAETIIPLAHASRLIPGRPHAATLWRWHARGVRGVRLEIARVGGRVYTSREALQRFADRLSGGDTTTSLPRTPTQRRRASERAAKQLEAAGI